MTLIFSCILISICLIGIICLCVFAIALAIWMGNGKLRGIGKTQTREKDGMAMVYIPAGLFTMGAENGNRDELPAHKVKLDAYWIDRTEVTNAMYAACIKAGACVPPSDTSSSGRFDYFGNPQYSDYPVIYVDWDKANTYCIWAGAHLPSEAEWEKAAKGTDLRIYPWGITSFNGRANYDGIDTTPVGIYENGKSPYGAYDMGGNVWEWVNDWYDQAYYSNSPRNNPPGPEKGKYRILHGNAWSSFGYGPRITTRFWVDPSYSNYDVGFRCAHSSP